jgi:hypothetical protein
MSAPIKPFDFDTFYADDVASFADASSDAARAQRFLDLQGDDLYAPADVSETSIGPVPMRRVRTLTNSPSCTPADLSQSDADADANSQTTTETGRPVRRLQSVRADAWVVPAPANWGRTRRAVGMRKIASPSSHSPRQARSRAARAQSPSSDWALPF